MYRTTTTMILALLLSVGCNSGDIAGDWEGDSDCGEYSIEIGFELEKDEKDSFSGEGTFKTNCIYGEGESQWVDECVVHFDVEAETEVKFGEIEFEFDNCNVDGSSIPCPEDSELDYDGEDTMEGDDIDGCDIELERE
jgi:hypothetical protein